MKAILLLPVTAVLFIGCKDSRNAPAANQATTPADYLNQMVQAEKKASFTVDVASVNKAIEAFYIEEGRFPKDLLELVESGQISRIPKLPAGVTWQYDTNDGVVKIVKDSVEVESTPK